MLKKSLFLFAACALVAPSAFAADEPAGKPICCDKQAYCCTIKARCCESENTVAAEIIPLNFVKEEAARPTCCDKRAYCCTIKAPCCGKTVLIEVALLDREEKADAAQQDAAPICCAKRSYCCKIKATCCGTEATVDFEEKESTAAELAAFAADRDVSKPSCCVKRAYCCTIKSPCCGKMIELEIVR